MKSYKWWLGRKARVKKKYELLLGWYLSPKEVKAFEKQFERERFQLNRRRKRNER